MEVFDGGQERVKASTEGTQCACFGVPVPNRKLHDNDYPLDMVGLKERACMLSYLDSVG